MFWSKVVTIVAFFKRMIAYIILNPHHENHPFLPQLPPTFIPAPTIQQSVAGPLSAMGAFLILVGIAMATSYFAASSNTLIKKKDYGYNYVVPLIETAHEKY